MNARLLSYEDQMRSIRQDAEGLMTGLSDAQFNWPPAPGRWSMAGCFDHLNKSAADLFIPMIDEAIAGARARGLKSDGPFAYSAFERWRIRNNDAPAKMKFKFDGSDATVLIDGKPNGETMALKRVDERRMTTVFKRNGKVFRASTAIESTSRTTLTVENEFIKLPDARTGDAIRRLRRFQTPLPNSAAAWLSARARPSRALNGFGSDDNIGSSFSKSGGDNFH